MRKSLIMISWVLLVLYACNMAPPEPRLSIEDAWARSPVTENGNGAIYFRLVNTGREADILVDVASPAATAELRQSVVKENGVMGMEPMVSVEIPAGGEVEFKQGGMHVMLIGIKQPLSAGEAIAFTLTFKHAGEIQYKAEVRRP